MSEQKTAQPEPAATMPEVQENAPPSRKPSLHEDPHSKPESLPQPSPTHIPIPKKQSIQHEQPDELNKSSSRNKVQVSLPYLGSQANYGDRIFDKQSASTLQKTILVYSIPKAHRFNSDPKYSGEPSYCLDTCFKPSPLKGAGFGFGRKKQFPDWMERNMKENPPPGAYFQNLTEIKRKGKTFGISHKYYEKVLIPKEKHSQTRRLSPINDKTK